MLKYPLNVTIDNNIFYENKYDLSDNGTLKVLIKHVKDGKVKVVLSNIVVREAKNNIKKQITYIINKSKGFKKELKKYSSEFLIRCASLGGLFDIKKDKSIAEGISFFEKYLRDIEAEVMGNELIDLDVVIDNYFDIIPPFAPEGPKRKEFPDAFIVNQIEQRFGNDETVYIISKDKGFINACKNKSNHVILGSLGQLYDMINEEVDNHKNVVEIVNNSMTFINDNLSDFILDNSNIEVIGMSYDNDGIVYGYDYTDFSVYSIDDLKSSLHYIEDITESSAIISLFCKAKIVADCYYKDYDNAPWDSEEKEFFFVDTITIREEHNAKFMCRIKFDVETKEIDSIYDFTILLNGDTREKRYKVESELDQEDIDYEYEFEDMDRQYLGFTSLNNYEPYLEEDLYNSVFSAKTVNEIKKLNLLYHEIEEVADRYDILVKKIEDLICEDKNIDNTVHNEMYSISNKQSIDNGLEAIKGLLENKSENLHETGTYNIPEDSLKYGDIIVFKGLLNDELMLSIDDLYISSEKGQVDILNVTLHHNQDTLASGEIIVTYGFLDFNEDGNVEDGVEDIIEYRCDDIIDAIQLFINEQKKIVQNEKERIDALDNYFEKISH